MELTHLDSKASTYYKIISYIEPQILITDGPYKQKSLHHHNKEASEEEWVNSEND